MRVISGTAKGRKLKEPAGFQIRPTSDKVKESVFNMIQFDLPGKRVLDLFAGTGQMGIEALSRGAGSSVFVDSNPAAVKLIYENLKLCGFMELASVHTRDAIRFLEGDETYDIVFLDPPYDMPLADRALSGIIEFDKLNIDGIIICETKASRASPAVSPPYLIQKEYIYGGVKITRYGRAESPGKKYEGISGNAKSESGKRS